MTKLYDKNPALVGKDTDMRSRRYISPTRVVWTSAAEGAEVKGAENLLLAREEQMSFGDFPYCWLINKPGRPKASILVDYGTEIHGSVRLFIRGTEHANGKYRVNLRVRLGESAMEAMTDLGVKNTTNDHANRDMVINVGGMSSFETNESGFRFMRIDLLDEDAAVTLKSANAVLIFRDIDYLGSFECSDPLLNKIWDTAAYTTHLNMQEYLWDGIKRDRLIWIGDMHTEVMTILAAFGYNDVVPRSLDVAKLDTPITDEKMAWMTGHPSYSLWWLLNHYEWYIGTGDLVYLQEQKEYLKKLLAHLVTLVDENGVEQLPEKFLDWPTRANAKASHAGMQGLLKMGLDRGVFLMEVLGEKELSRACAAAAERMLQYVPDTDGAKQSGAMMVLGGLADPKEMNEKLIAVNGARGFSTFMGYYILKAKAMAGDYQGALDAIREYWGGMLKMGATTFWEDFNLDWMENAAPIDELVPEGKVDIHGDWGAYCYISFRHSLCHGWASGPCPYMTHYVLGVTVEEAGCKKLRIEPHLEDLEYAKGTYPTPYGVVTISHTKLADGTVQTEVDAPEGVEIVK